MKRILRVLLSLMMTSAMVYTMSMVTFAEAEYDPVPAKGSVELVKATKSGNNAVKLSWNKVDAATKYTVYGQKAGNGFKKIIDTKQNAYTVKKIKGVKLKAHKYYKFYIAAYNGDEKIATSRTICFITANTCGKYANAKSIKVNLKAVTLKPGGSVFLKVSTKIYNNKKHIKKSFGSATGYISDCREVATVNSKGVIKAVAPGKATIYVQDIGGLYCKTNVTVKQDKFTVSFDANGHGTAPETQMIVKGGQVVKPVDLAVEGYKFEGWFKEKACINEWDFNTDTVTDDTRLFAKWTECTSILTYDANGHGIAPEAVLMKYSEEIKAAAAITGVAGYSFKEWNTQADGKGKSYATGSQVKASNTESEGVKLYAIWEGNEYEVTFDRNGGDTDATPISIIETYGDKYLLPTTNPTKTGYSFEGWFTESTGGRQVTAETEVTITEAQKLYAHWGIIKYTVKIITDGNGIVTPTVLTNIENNTPIRSEGNTLIVGETVVTASANEGYEFKEWKGASLDIITENITVTAKFKEKNKYCNHSSSEIFKTYLNNTLKLQVTDNDGNILHDEDITVKELEDMKGIISQEEIYSTETNVWEGLNVYQLLQKKIPKYVSEDKLIAIYCYAKDYYYIDLLAKVGFDWLKNGAKDGEKRVPVILAYAKDGYPLASGGKNDSGDKCGPGYDSVVDNKGGPLCLMVHNAMGACLRETVKIVVKVVNDSSEN